MRRIVNVGRLRIFIPIQTEYSRFKIYFERIYEIASLIGFFQSHLTLGARVAYRTNEHARII